MDKYKAFRKQYNDAGIRIYAFKLPPTRNLSDQEHEYIWNVGETLGANTSGSHAVFASASFTKESAVLATSQREVRAVSRALARGCYDAVQQICRAAGLTREVVHESNENSVSLSLISTSGVVTLYP